MRLNPDHLVDWRASARRIVVHAVVIGLHLGLAVLLLGPVSRWHDTHVAPPPAAELLQLRFVATATRTPRTIAVPAPSIVRVRKRLATARAAAVITASTAPTVPVPRADVPTPGDEPGYIPGGTLLGGADQHQRPATRLPGSAVVIVPGLPMIDPRMQGAGGAVRKLQALFGVPDRHCVDVDAWRTLSTQELLDRHVSPEQVERTAAEYHCFARNS